jgi:hypothetical protein
MVPSIRRLGLCVISRFGRTFLINKQKMGSLFNCFLFGKKTTNGSGPESLPSPVLGWN